MNNIDILIENITEPSWVGNVDHFLQKSLKKLEIDNWEFSVTFCDDDFIHKLNREYRSIDSATDVLTFAQNDKPLPFEDNDIIHNAGDIIISLHTLKENADYFGVEKEEELKGVLIHGILHLNGMDHSDNLPDQDMLKIQEQLMLDLTEVKIF